MIINLIKIILKLAIRTSVQKWNLQQIQLVMSTQRLYGNQALQAYQDQQNNDFYKLHYPNRKSPPAASKASNKMRSKSVLSVLQPSPSLDLYNPKGSIGKMLADKQVRSRSLFNKDGLQEGKIRQNLSFKTVLSSKTAPRDLSSVNLPINNLKDVEQLAHKNVNIRLALQRSKDEKIKMNKIVLSHKQTQQVKLDYLTSKREEVEGLINEQINGIYEEFFKKEYQLMYGAEEGEDRFQVKLAELVNVLSRRIFNNN